MRVLCRLVAALLALSAGVSLGQQAELAEAARALREERFGALKEAVRDRESHMLAQRLRQLKDEERRAGEARQQLRLVREAPKVRP